MINHHIVVTEDTFKKVVLDAEGPVLVDFWAPWCPPCRVLGPRVDQIAAEQAGILTVAKVDIQEFPIFSKLYSIKSIPLLMLFKGGKLQKSLVGLRPKNEIMDEIQAFLS